MAGMLPGVECARRRRFHQSGACSSSPITMTAYGGTRRSSFCLYRSNHEPQHHNSYTSLKGRLLNQTYQDDQKLGEVAREAKERLDERLRTQRKTNTKSKESVKCHGEGRSMVLGELQTEVFGSKKGGTRRFSWAKLRWKLASEQDECAVCLEQFKTGETLVHLPCAHRFHVKCLVPWLQNNAHCPCCRMGILILQSR